VIVGMDFGTTNSGMAVYDGRTLRLLPIDPSSENPFVARTALYITNQKRIAIGREAIDRYYAENLNRQVRYERVWVGEVEMVFAELPPMIKDVYIEKDVFSPGCLFLSFKTGLSAMHYVGTTVGTDFYFIEDITALYFYVARRRAERLLGQELTRIVLGRPVYFNLDPQADRLAQQRLLAAAFRAGFEEVTLQPEPIAAAYFYETTIDHPQNVLIFDFGGGTLDISVARLGASRQRALLSTGGIPIAGDIFDRKIARAKLPPHFGEHSTYTNDYGASLPVPNHYYEAFSDWQTLLELNAPQSLRHLERIARTAHKPRQIEALLSLVKSSYGLRIYDEVETAKRALSSMTNAAIRLDGPGFQVRDLITRAEFERLLVDERAAIEATLDEVVRQAGLRPDQIDAVIRTGGSSQVPVFVDLLRERFGAEKVRAIDTFSSVTSGLGILAHRLERGEIDAQTIRASEWRGGGRVRNSDDPARKRGVPPIDLDVVKRFIEVQEHTADSSEALIGVIALSGEGEVRAALHALDGAAEIPAGDGDLAASLPGGVMAAPADARLLLMTTEYRFMFRALRELAEMHALGLRLADVENLRADAFGSEVVSGLQVWQPPAEAEYLALVSTKGYVRLMRAETVRDRLSQPVPFTLETLPGYPAALVALRESDDLLLVSSAGNVLRMPVAALRQAGSRVMRVAEDARVVSGLCLAGPARLIVADAKGRAKCIPFDALAPAAQTAAGQRALGQDFRALAIADYAPASIDAWVITTRRLVRLHLPDGSGDMALRPLLRMARGETLVGLHLVNSGDAGQEPLTIASRVEL